MKKQTRMILFAALLSASVFVGTRYWYLSQMGSSDQDTGVKPVAYAASVHEDVRRRPAARLIWQNVSSGEALYPGEAIKTSSKSEVRIQFADSDRYIDLDPESQVVISSNSNEISLDLMDGSIFVAGGDNKSGGPALTLNSANGKVDLSKATASLSKSGGKVDVQVLKGSATDGSGKTLSDNSGTEPVKILFPKSDGVTIINPDNGDPVKFSWQGFPAGDTVNLFVGSSRKDLKQVAQSPAGQNFLEKRLPVGKHFFQLVAVDPKNADKKIESLVHRFEVVAKFAPSPVFPANDSSLIMNKASNPITFKWSKPEDAKKVGLEISKDPSFKNKLTSQIFEKDEQSYTHSLPMGDYFWRLSSSYEGVDKLILTKPVHFSITGKPKVPLKIVWEPKQDKETQYFVEQASLSMAWNVDHKNDVKSWKLHVWPAKDGREPAAESEKVINTMDMKAKLDVPKAGSYNAMIEAYNENEVLLASSDVKTFDATVKPLLAAPVFFPEKGDLRADNRGNLALKWNKDKEAKEFELILMDKDGKEIKRGKFQGASTSLVNLMPGNYKVSIIATDVYGRESQPGHPRSVTVPDTSGLKAPKLKKVQVN